MYLGKVISEFWEKAWFFFRRLILFLVNFVTKDLYSSIVKVKDRFYFDYLDLDLHLSFSDVQLRLLNISAVIFIVNVVIIYYIWRRFSKNIIKNFSKRGKYFHFFVFDFFSSLAKGNLISA